MKTPFEILNVPESASDEDAKAAYLSLIRQFPPERFPAKFKEVKDAFEQIKTERARIAYRLFHFAEPTPADLLAALTFKKQSRVTAEKLVKILADNAKRALGLLLMKKLEEQ